MSTVQRKPTTSLASYDIELLKVWYGVLRDSSGRLYIQPSACRADIPEGPEPPPQLVVFLHDFEQFDESVVQDLFYICRWATNSLLYASLKEYQLLRAATSPDSCRRVVVALSFLPTDHVPTVRSVFTPSGHIHSSIGTRFT